MSEEEHFIVLRLKLWLPPYVMQNADIDLMKKQVSRIKINSFMERFRAMIPREIIVFYMGFLGKTENEVIDLLMEKSKIEFDVE